MDGAENPALEMLYALMEHIDEIQLGGQGGQLHIIPGSVAFPATPTSRSITLLVYWQPTTGEDSRTLSLSKPYFNTPEEIRLLHPELEETARCHFNSWSLIEDGLAVKFTNLISDDTLHNCKLVCKDGHVLGSFAKASDELTKREKDEKKVWALVQPIEVPTADQKK
ncbi:hypothetical protein DL770_004681 [Monosporascus sp. CRB-9-2]|nr:hypothetical protein DL770_004681 [Monosporascus sp. CRB-9-2]